MEFDEYDSKHTIYLLGVKDNDVVCSVRLIETCHHNMIVGTFFRYFEKGEIPASSQFLNPAASLSISVAPELCWVINTRCVIYCFSL